jgi:hypothetical protein
VIEAGVPLTGAGGGGRVDAPEIGDHLLARVVRAVKVEPVEHGLLRVPEYPVVVLAQPSDEVQHHRVAPHPRREPLEAAQRLLGGGVVATTLDVPVDPVGIGPVPLHRDGAEPLLLDEPPRHGGAGRVELVRAVGGPADQHQAGVAHEIEQRLRHGSAVLHRHGLRADGRDVPGALRPGSRRKRGRRRPQEIPYVLDGDLSEVPVRLVGREVRRGGGRADQLVRLHLQLLAGGFRGGGHGDHHVGRTQPAQGLDGGPHDRPCGETVVDEDRDPALHPLRLTALAEVLLPEGDLASLPVRYVLHDLRWDGQAPDDVVVERDHPVSRDGAHGEILLAGYT